jgi:signal transduction histidine kinase
VISFQRFNARTCAWCFMPPAGKAEPPFRESDVEMFQILARQAATALENARLYAEQLEYVRKVEESQKALLQAEKMAAAGRLSASIAHEINNPLASRAELPAPCRARRPARRKSARNISTWPAPSSNASWSPSAACWISTARMRTRSSRSDLAEMLQYVLALDVQTA